MESEEARRSKTRGCHEKYRTDTRFFFSLFYEHELNRMSSIVIHGSYVSQGRCMICDIFVFKRVTTFALSALIFD